MEVMSTKMFRALVAAATPKENAQEAATTLGDFEKKIIRLKGSLQLTRWLLTLNIILTTFVIVRLLQH